jgi:ribosomal protein L11 methyltransferase
MEWVELTLPAGALADEIAAILVDIEPVYAEGAEIRGEDIVIYSPADAAPAIADAIRAAAKKLAAQGFEVDADKVRVKPAPPEEEWRDAWKRYFHIKRFGKRIIIVPSWERESYRPEPGDVMLDLDPGRAFGTGAHASTRLCLVELEELADVHGVVAKRMLDVGTGSGILSVAAAKLWPACTGVAVDVDPIAVGAARENLDQNGVGARFETAETPVDEIAETFDVVCANIQADILLSLREAIAARVAPGGALVLSGLLHDQAGFVGDKYVAAGLTLVRTHQLDDDRDWTSVLLRRA